jgi:hypothetical protein
MTRRLLASVPRLVEVLGAVEVVEIGKADAVGVAVTIQTIGTPFDGGVARERPG